MSAPKNKVREIEELLAADESGVGELFAPGGVVSSAVRHFEARPQQAGMAAAVHQAIVHRRHLAVEAGTGVGKSLAYLIPAGFWAVRNGKKVVVATYTKALQAQLVKKDLPMAGAVLKELGLELSYFLLMGSSNYVCLSRLGRAEMLGPELFDEAETRGSLAELREYAKTGESGCRPEIPFDVPQRVWEEVCRDPDVCLHKKCPLRDSCFYRRDVARAAASDIIVVNQHLFFAGMPLPAFGAVIFDEAHNLEDVAGEYMGFSLTDRRVKRFLDSIASGRNKGMAHRIKKMPADLLADIHKAVVEAGVASRFFFQDLADAAGFGLDGGAFPRPRRVFRPNIVANRLEKPLLALTVLLSQAATGCRTMQEEAEMNGCQKRCMAIAAQVAEFLKYEEGPRAYWVEQKSSRKRPEISLNMAPVDVAGALRKELFGREFPVVLTSATLTVDSSFNMLNSRLGLDNGLELLLDSPFDYGRQAAFYVPRGVPDPKDAADYEKAVINNCFQICAAVEEGIFLLFTSWQSLEHAYSVLSAQLSGRPLFRQSDGHPQHLLAEFKRAGNGILFATDTFWQGVDVPGQALSCVVMARLPFSAPDTPLEEARKEWMTAKGLDFFRDYALPKAVVKFRQGFGRLIRTKKDYGAVAVLDPRIQTRYYGARFSRSIPRCRRILGITDLKAFFDERKAGTPANK